MHSAAFAGCTPAWPSQSAGLRYARPYLRLTLKMLDDERSLVNRYCQLFHEVITVAGRPTVTYRARNVFGVSLSA